MKTRTLLIAFLALFVSGELLAAELVSGRLARIELRESGFHGIYLRIDKNTVDFPNAGCDLFDRGVIDENNGSGLTLIQALNSLRINSRNRVIVRFLVDGCVTINGPNSLTAPKIVKLEILDS